MLKRFPIIITLLAVISTMWTSTPLAAAPNPVSVVLGGTGSASWNITGIAPGDSGTKSVSVQNAGTGTGELRIWLSNITGTEGTPAGFETPTPGDAGELGQYLTLRVQGSGINSNVSMPALPGDFPAGAADTRYIKTTLNSGQTINLAWTWGLPSSTGNMVQGDGISFTINYTLNEVVAPPSTTDPEPAPPATTGPVPTTPVTTVPPTTAAPTTIPPVTSVVPTTTNPTPTTAPPTEIRSREIEIKIFGKQTSGILTPDGRLKSSLIAASPDGDIVLAFPAGMLMASDDGEALSAIDVSLYTGTLPSSTGQLVLGSVYSLTAYDSSGHNAPFVSDLPFLLSLPFEQSQVPAGTQSVYVGYFDLVAGRWVRLPAPASGTPDDQVQSLLNHLSLFAVLADVAPNPHVPAASFEVGRPNVPQGALPLNKPVTISTAITNIGDASGEYLLHAYIPGLLDSTQLVMLGPRASQEVSFTVVPHQAGTYTVSIGEQQVSFVVSEEADEPGGIRELIRRNIETYIGFSIVLILSIALVGATLFGGKRQQSSAD